MTDNLTETAAVGAAKARFVVNGDQESWLTQRLHAAIRMARACDQQVTVGADEMLRIGAVDGIIKAAAIDIIQMLGGQPAFENLPRYQLHYVLDRGEAIADDGRDAVVFGPYPKARRSAPP